MRVGIIGLSHESNTFLRRPTTLGDFRAVVLARGGEVRRHYAGGHHEVSGFFEGLEREGIEAVPIFAAGATPGGTIAGETYRALLDGLFEALEEARAERGGTGIDGLLLAPHGAAVCEDFPDMDGDWLGRVRELVGPGVPMIATLDPHANLSPAMVAACDALIPYRTNPHVDQKVRGMEAARLMGRTLRGEVKPRMAARFPAVAINIACQHTEALPCSELVKLSDAQLRRGGVLANGVILGFPYADVAELGSAFVAVTDGDAAVAQGLADEMGAWLIEHRRDFVAKLQGVEEAIRQARSAAGRVCLLDLGDNVGGGSPGDGTLIAQALMDGGDADWRGFVCLWDPEAAAAAAKLGAGGKFGGLVGGKTDVLHGAPLCLANARIRSVHDGVFRETAIRHGGQRDFNMGKTVVLEAAGGGVTLLVHSIRTPPFSLQQLISCGIDPAEFRVLVAKGVNAPIAAYREVCDLFIQVDTPGVTTAGMTRLAFKRRRRPLFPFEEIG
jgi:microcystin degradation protein MlrC